MERFFGIFGISAILALAYAMSNNKKAINWRTIISGLILQVMTAVFVLKTAVGQKMFFAIGEFITKILEFADKGGHFVFGGLVNKPMLDGVFGVEESFLFAFKVAPTIIFVAALVSMAYHIGLMQRIVAVAAKIVYKIMGVSGSEALSNASSAFVGQVEAQILIKPYVSGMTKSELLASMTGSMACIAGGVMAVYISMGVPAQYLLAASIMAAPGALVIAKMVFPETEESETKDNIKLEIKKTHANLVDALAHGASEGMRISINVIAMLIAFIAVVHMTDAVLAQLGIFFSSNGLSLAFIGIDLKQLSLSVILGKIFSLFAWLMGVPWGEAGTVGSLMGTKMVLNEFVAYMNLAPILKGATEIVLSQKSIIISSFALCGFANFGSIAIQVGGIGEIAPNRRADLARLGFKALICGTMASYLSASIAGILY